MKRLFLAAMMLLAACAGSASCSSSERVNLASAPPPPSAPIFVEPNDHDASTEGGGGDGPLFACINTECPVPFATCNSVEAPTFKCGTDLSRDNNNCGACGNKCVDYLPINMKSRCADGACALQCYKHFSGLSKVFEDWTDCNGLVEDGCEINLTNDPNNCGVCGNKCAAGIPCINAQCGCSGGLILCDGQCVDPQQDDNHCGGCGHACELPGDACSPMQPHSAYGCVQGVCGRKKCVPDLSGQWYDCNHDLFSNTCTGDGCETLGLSSKENCGACGVKCKGDEECVDEGNGFECAVPCVRSGKVSCGNHCADLLNDRENCGACGHSCRPPGFDEERVKQTASCNQGLCVYECQPGFADCNGDPTDGCETNLRINPQNCGACGVTCNVVAGQPCVEGKCLMKECDAGVTN